VPPVSKFARLPVAVQREIERRLIRDGFSGYRPLARELRARGFDIGKSALQQAGARLQARVESLRDEHLAEVAGFNESGAGGPSE